MWEFLSLWCVWVNSLFYHHRYSRVSWMVIFCVFWCPQQHQPDEPGLPPEPWQPGAWWAAIKSAAHSGKYNHLFRKHEKTWWRNTKCMVIQLYLRGKRKIISWILGTVNYRSVETQPYMKSYFTTRICDPCGSNVLCFLQHRVVVESPLSFPGFCYNSVNNQPWKYSLLCWQFFV